LYSIKVSYVVT